MSIESIMSDINSQIAALHYPDAEDDNIISYNRPAKVPEARSETTFGKLKRRASFGGSSALQVDDEDEGQVPVKERGFGKLRRSGSISGLATFNNEEAPV